MNKLDLLAAIKRLSVEELKYQMKHIDYMVKMKGYKNIEQVTYSRMEIENALNARM